MWERWGSPDPAAFPDPIASIAVAMASGLIHGARGVLQEYMSSPVSPYRDVPDALCAPSAGVLWRSPGMLAPALGLGDLYYPLLTDPVEPYGLQAERLFSCAAAGMRDVYAAAGEQHGPMAPLDPVLRPLDPLSDECFAQRATNRAMQTGAALELVKNDGTPERIALDGDLATALVIAGAEGGLPSETMQERYRLDMANALFRIRVGAEVDPDGVEAASGRLPPLLGVLPNGAYVTSPPAPYVDPALPWPAGDLRTLALERTFHRAHAPEWCMAMGRREGLGLSSLRSRAQSDLPPEERAAAIALCAELAARHLRFGKDETAYDTTHEPLCAFVPDTIQYAYTGEEGEVGPDDFAATRDAAASWCVATTTTTTTSSTTTTVPLGARVQVGHVGAVVDAVADVGLPGVPGDSHRAVEGRESLPFDESVGAAAAVSRPPPKNGTGTADSSCSLSTATTFDAEGNLTGVSASGDIHGDATLTGLVPGGIDIGFVKSTGLSGVSVNFRVIGAPVRYTFSATVSSLNLYASAGARLQIARGDIVAVADSIPSTETPEHVVQSGVLEPREEEYWFVAQAGGGYGIYDNRDTVGEFQGVFTVTLTLGPVGE